MDFTEKMYTAHAKMVYGFLLSKTGDTDLSEELTQETFYRAIKNIDSFKEKSSVSTWLCGIANNLWREYLRTKKEHCNIDDMENEIPVGSAEEDVLVRTDSVELLKLLHKLPEPGREVLYLRIMGELTFKEIGEIMGQSENWARVTFYRGKEKIAKGVQNDEK